MRRRIVSRVLLWGPGVSFEVLLALLYAVNAQSDPHAIFRR